jgi:hypothetical protein
MKPRYYPIFASSDDVTRGRTGYIHLTFNLRHPINEQLDRAKALLRQWQDGHISSGAIPAIKDKRIKTPELLPMYLRMLERKPPTHRTGNAQRPGKKGMANDRQIDGL